MTRQVSDILIYEGKRYNCSLPLPEKDKRIIKLTDIEYKALFDDGDEERKLKLQEINDEIDKKLEHNEKLTGETSYTLSDNEVENLKKYTYVSPANGTNSTACWRRYIATWEIKDDILCLNGVKGKYKLASDSPIVADWYSNILKVGFGKVVHANMLMAAADLYEKEMHFTIVNGIVKNQEIFEMDEINRLRFEEGKKGNGKERSERLREFLNEIDDE